MTDALSSAASVSSAAVHQPAAVAPASPAPSAAAARPTHININQPFYISPAVSFDPITSIVFVTFRNFETGKVRQQIPPKEVLTRYRNVDETGIPDPTLPQTTPAALAGQDRRSASPPVESTTPPPPTPPATSFGQGASTVA